jgi:CDP-6-deoxy-D-xylo-4-hexulose-3-dehydrase
LTASTFYKERETKRKLLRFIAGASQLSFGKECLAFERAFAIWQGRRDAIFFNSGSSANFALLQALVNVGKLKRGDRVAFSAVTWSTNVMPLITLGLTPVPMDISLETLNVPSTEVERAITKHTIKAVFITNLLGFSHDLARTKAVCKKYSVLLLEDNCESLGSVEHGVKLGNFGLASTFSFFVGHHLSTIEGGMVCTDDTKLADALRIVRAHGWDRHLPVATQAQLRKKYSVDPFYALYTFYDVGFNFRPNEINGCIGNIVLPFAEAIVVARARLFEIFARTLASRPDAYLPLKSSHMNTLSAFAIPVVCTSPAAKKRLMAACKDRIEIRPIVGGNMILQPFFRKYFPNTIKKYPTPNATYVHKLGLYLPLRPDLTKTKIDDIKKILASV